MGVTVNGVEIAEERIAGEMARLREDYVAYVKANGGDSDEAQLREWAEENLIENELFRQEALATQPEPSDERARQNIEACPDFYENIPEGDRLPKSKEALRMRALEKEIRKRVPKVSDADLKREYDAHAEACMTSETFRFSHICRLIGPGGSARADAYLELLRLRTDVSNQQINWFEALEASDTYREDYGAFAAVGRGDLPEEIEKHLFALPLGGVSDVVELDGRSLHLFRLLAIDPPEKVRFEEIRDRLRSMLFDRAHQETLEKCFDDLKAKAVIRREV